MDSARERWLAALLGGSGTLVAVTVVEVVPEMLRRDLTLRWQAAAFFAMVFAVGALFGWIGHFLFIYVARGPIVGRAIVVGAAMGAAIGGITWLFTFLGRDVFFPFHPRAGYVEALVQVSRTAMIAGPLGGVAASLAVVRHLRKKTGEKEPLDG